MKVPVYIYTHTYIDIHIHMHMHIGSRFRELRLFWAAFSNPLYMRP